MAQDVTVDFGSFTISRQTDKSLCLTVSTVISLSLPDNLPTVPTAVELWDQVKTGSLWLTRAGSCRFELSTNFEELDTTTLCADFQVKQRRTAIQAFQTFPVS